MLSCDSNELGGSDSLTPVTPAQSLLHSRYDSHQVIEVGPIQTNIHTREIGNIWSIDCNKLLKDVLLSGNEIIKHLPLACVERYNILEGLATAVDDPCENLKV